jgi:two-component system chemotaxis sensor kinase CheA
MSGARAPASSSVCRLPSDDPWMQNMLRPIVEAAGYRVVGEADEAADLVIASQGRNKVEAAAPDDLAALRARAAGRDDSIYRYDRAGPADGAQVRRRGEGQ